MILRIAESRHVSQQETLANDDMTVDVNKTARMGCKHQQEGGIVGYEHVHDIVMTHVVNLDQLFVCFRIDDALRFTGLLLVAIVVLAVGCCPVLHDLASR